MKIDIVLIKPGSQQQLYGELSDYQLTAIEPPLWGAILAAYLRQKNYSVMLLDAEAENWSYEQTAKKIIDINPLLAAVVVSGTNPSASTMNMTGAGEIVHFIRQLNPAVRTLLAGLHPSALPEQTMKEEAVGFVCQGEGFFTLPPLLDALRANAATYKISGLWYRQNGQVACDSPSLLLDDLNILPRPAWDLLPMDKYRAHNWHCFDDIKKRQPYAVLYTSLGCPFHCSFCCINALFGKNTIRYRGIDSVMDEIDFLVQNYGVRNIKIMDEMFAMNERRVIELCERIIQRRYNLNMWAYARVNTVTKPMLAKMKEAGIHWVSYGFESGSKRVIEDVTKGYRMELVHDAVKMTYDLDMHICANYIVGLPEDDYDSMNDTLKLLLDINAEWSNIYSAMAYPGSQLYEQAVEKGWPLPKSWENFSQYGRDTLPLPTRYLTGGQVLAFRDYAFSANYSSPRYLNMISRKFGPETMEYIRQMSAKPIKRNYADV